ncbi:MFS general substrate transporter [Clavulina sp. PMI_390]|nr:MFS general substrate transporter [Clavulina sp. PMI_390]
MSSEFAANDTKLAAEKPGADIEIVSSSGDPEPAVSASSTWTAAADRKLLRKIDFTLMPWLTLLYLLSCLDRVCIGNAKLYGLEKDLHMTDNQYLWALTVFYFSYAAFEIPSNLLLKKLSPRFWLSTIMVIWGTIMTCQGLVHNAGGLTAVRFCLGIVEAGAYPGVSYYLSCWYKRSELGFRAALFWSAATGSVAFGGLLAAAISNMKGVGGKSAWSWIFILLGLATVVVGAASYFIIQDFPAEAKFLKEDERAQVIRRLQDDAQYSAGGESLNKQHMWAAVKDWKTWLGSKYLSELLLPMMLEVPVYSLALFMPSIINQLGYHATPANLLSAPPNVWGAIVCVAIGFLADHSGRRGLYNIALLSIAIVGYIILIVSRHAKLSYFAIFLCSTGISPVIRTSAWVSNNVEGSYKRAVVIAMMIGFANLNAPVGVNVYRATDKPWYRTGHIVILAYLIIGLVASVISIYMLNRENKARDGGLRDERILTDDASGKGDECPGGTYETVDEARKDKGDLWSGYRYVL